MLCTNHPLSHSLVTRTAGELTSLIIATLQARNHSQETRPKRCHQDPNQALWLQIPNPPVSPLSALHLQKLRTLCSEPSLPVGPAFSPAAKEDKGTEVWGRDSSAVGKSCSVSQGLFLGADGTDGSWGPLQVLSASPQGGPGAMLTSPPSDSGERCQGLPPRSSTAPRGRPRGVPRTAKAGWPRPGGSDRAQSRVTGQPDSLQRHSSQEVTRFFRDGSFPLSTQLEVSTEDPLISSRLRGRKGGERHPG